MFILIFRLIPEFVEWSEGYEPDATTVFSAFGPLFFIGLFMGLLSLGLLIFFIVHLIRHKGMDSAERVIWILVFLFAGIVGYPIYWYMRVWKNE
jgi:hypothetical protein